MSSSYPYSGQQKVHVRSNKVSARKNTTKTVLFMQIAQHGSDNSTISLNIGANSVAPSVRQAHKTPQRCMTKDSKVEFRISKV